MSIDDLARLTQEEFIATRGEITVGFAEVLREMATKNELTTLREETAQGFRDVLQSVKADLQDAVTLIQGEVKQLNYAVEIDELRRRVDRLEQKTTSRK